jgi:hypothetical protein
VIYSFIEREVNNMPDCRYCVNMDSCQYVIAPDDCEDFEETFEHHWEMMDDIEKEEYNDLYR